MVAEGTAAFIFISLQQPYPYEDYARSRKDRKERREGINRDGIVSTILQ